jgi:transcriptional regulator with XRE-family HTH domain
LDHDKPLVIRGQTTLYRDEHFSFVIPTSTCYCRAMPRRIEPNPSALKVGERLRELRLERNMSLAQLADVAKLSKGHLSSVEHGLAAITVQTISRLAKGLDVPALYLLTFPADDERDKIAEMVRKLPAPEVTKLRRELTKTAKEVAKEAAKLAAKTAKTSPPRGRP